MSADNYILVDKRRGKYVVLANLSASSDYAIRHLNRIVPNSVHDSLEDAVMAAHNLDARDYYEYGVSISTRARKDAAAC